MGAAQSIPIIGEIVTAAEVVGKTIAAGGCALVGNHKAADSLMQGAKNSLVHYSEVNLIVSNVRVIAAKINHDDKEANRLLAAQGKAWKSVAEGTPVVGHVIGLYHYARGETKQGDDCMISATRFVHSFSNIFF